MLPLFSTNEEVNYRDQASFFIFIFVYRLLKLGEKKKHVLKKKNWWQKKIQRNKGEWRLVHRKTTLSADFDIL